GQRARVHRRVPPRRGLGGARHGAARHLDRRRRGRPRALHGAHRPPLRAEGRQRSEEHTSELQSLTNLVCRLLLEKKKQTVRNREEKDLKQMDGNEPSSVREPKWCQESHWYGQSVKKRMRRHRSSRAVQ